MPGFCRSDEPPAPPNEEEPAEEEPAEEEPAEEAALERRRARNLLGEGKTFNLKGSVQKSVGAPTLQPTATPTPAPTATPTPTPVAPTSEEEPIVKCTEFEGGEPESVQKCAECEVVGKYCVRDPNIDKTKASYDDTKCKEQCTAKSSCVAKTGILSWGSDCAECMVKTYDDVVACGIPPGAWTHDSEKNCNDNCDPSKECESRPPTSCEPSSAVDTVDAIVAGLSSAHESEPGSAATSAPALLACGLATATGRATATPPPRRRSPPRT